MNETTPYFNDFRECLAQSHAAEDLSVWEEVYRKAFPGMVGMVSYRQDGFWQREGIDRGILLNNTKQIFIDEKIRGTNKITGKVYEDISLEYISNNTNGAAGWVCKQLRADYIAYLIAPIGKCYLLPVIQLQQAWELYGREWRTRPRQGDSYGERSARNNGYLTWFCPVPVPELFSKIGSLLRIEFEPFEFTE